MVTTPFHFRRHLCVNRPIKMLLNQFYDLISNSNWWSSLPISMTIFVRCSRRALIRIDVSSVDIDWPMVEFDTPARDYSYAHLWVNISASVSLFVPLEARMHSPRRRASTDIVLVCDRLIVFTGHISVCGLLSGSMLCSNLRKKNLTSQHYFFLAHRSALCEHRLKKLQKWARLIIPWRCPLLLSLFGFKARQHCAHMATRGFICSAGGARA